MAREIDSKERRKRNGITVRLIYYLQETAIRAPRRKKDPINIRIKREIPFV